MMQVIVLRQALILLNWLSNDQSNGFSSDQFS
jgi:hypothetical protein